MASQIGLKPGRVLGSVAPRPCPSRGGRTATRVANRPSAELQAAVFAYSKNGIISPKRRSVSCRALAEPPAVSPEDKLSGTQGVTQLYRYPGLSEYEAATLLHKAQKVVPGLTGVDAESCFNIEVSEPLTEREAQVLAWLLRETFEPELLTGSSHLAAEAGEGDSVVEVGPRMSFSTAWSSNALSICSSVGLEKVVRMERSTRFSLKGSGIGDAEQAAFASLVHDKMTEQVYREPLTSFAVDKVPAKVKTVPVMTEGRDALLAINDEMGLAFDDWDIEYYYNMFANDLKRDPTNVELFDMAQSNSEHCRHWFFSGNMIIDGVAQDITLFQMVKNTLKDAAHNSVIGFKDNSSAIRGNDVTPLLPLVPGTPSPLAPLARDWDLLLTAETHNFPCAVAPYPGAETGAGGRIRDTHATGAGSIMGVATAGYCVGNLQLDDYQMPWEDGGFEYPPNLASPEQILIDASNGASDYGNKFGEPLVAGYTRTFGARLPDGTRREWLKPIMFSGGIGQIDHNHLEKGAPEMNMLVVKIGGPAYRIGMGGGAASSVPSGNSGDRADLDFNAVQRGDAEMSQKLWRVAKACVELGEANPIVQIHDQGAGGNCNVVKEIIYPLGAEVDIRNVKLGDATMSVLEIWGAEYQENDAILIKPESRELLQEICDRERCLMQVIGSLNGSGRIVLKDSQAAPDEPNPAVDLDLKTVLGELPRKTYSFDRPSREGLPPVVMPEDATTAEALDRVLRLPAVCSKRFLTTKVDRCVTGLVAQQQCVGPLQLPLADVAVMAQSHYDNTGVATSIGETPNKGMVDPGAMARLALTEALTNLVFAKVTDLGDVKASVNWMYAAKMENEGADMWDVCVALTEAMKATGTACDGGKDSLSMAAAAGGELVRAPGNLVISAYVGCPDITKTATPDLKLGDDGVLVHVDLGAGRKRLGGSALAQVYSQIGNVSPDVDMDMVSAAFKATQALIDDRVIAAGHDVSDGGLAVTLLEMAFGGNCGLQADIPPPAEDEGGAFAALFAEEPGLVLEVASRDADDVLMAYASAGVPAYAVGKVRSERECNISVGGATAIKGDTAELRDTWEATAFELEKRQCTEVCVQQEQAYQATREAPQWKLSYTPEWTPAAVLELEDKPKVAVIREEGSNGDREMAAALQMAGFEPWDCHMSDMLAGKVDLSQFRGVVFVGGFSYADVLDSAKGWAGTIRFNEALTAQFDAFYNRPDTFSLGVCNGCQLMALLGWVPGLDGKHAPDAEQPRLIHNESGRFECRWTHTTIQPSPAIMLQGMEDSQLGVWCAHGEGRAAFPDEAIRKAVLDGGLAPLRYADASGAPTTAYPACPNGSDSGIAGMCSPDGRHLAMMPHPERCFLGWQVPYVPDDVGIEASGPGPWLKLFQNARQWVSEYDASQN